MGLADFQLSADGGSTFKAANVALTNTPTATNALAYNASSTYSIVAKPVSAAGWNSFAWTIVTADDNHLASLPTVTTNPDKSCSFTVPKTGGSWTLELLVNNGLNPQTNAADPTLRQRLKIAVKNVGGAQEICVGEQYESDPSTGYAKPFNDIGRTGATAGVSSMNGLTGALSVAAGVGASVSAAGSTVTVSATSGSVTIPFGSATGNLDSTFVGPAGSVIDSILVTVTTACDPGATIDVGTPASPGTYLATTDVDITNAGGAALPYVKPFWLGKSLGANAVRVRRAGASVGGAGTVLVKWTTPAT